MNTLHKTILVTGGTGFIGSHTTIELLSEGYEVVIVDNLCNSNIEVLNRIKTITGKSPVFYDLDILDKNKLSKVFEEHSIDTVIHFAALKAVGESVQKPLEYYHNNIGGLLSLLEIMKEHNCKSIVFSSSATVYGDSKIMPLTEDCEKGKATNPYGQTKLMAEQILEDMYLSDPEWNIVLLRYFNPIGAHKSGLIGEDPKGIPNNLVPYITQVAQGELAFLQVFGNDYDTPDGTGVRDYIHVVDLAKGHVKALAWMNDRCGVEIFNLGTGCGYSVLEVLKAFEKTIGREIPHKIMDRRPGDIATCYSDPSKAKTIMGWEAGYDLQDMCEDAWRWQSMNPHGF